MTKMALGKVKQLSQRITQRQCRPPWASGNVQAFWASLQSGDVTRCGGGCRMLSSASGALLYTEDLPASEAQRVPAGKPQLRGDISTEEGRGEKVRLTFMLASWRVPEEKTHHRTKEAASRHCYCIGFRQHFLPKPGKLTHSKTGTQTLFTNGGQQQSWSLQSWAKHRPDEGGSARTWNSGEVSGGRQTQI